MVSGTVEGVTVGETVVVDEVLVDDDKVLVVDENVEEVAGAPDPSPFW